MMPAPGELTADFRPLAGAGVSRRLQQLAGTAGVLVTLALLGALLPDPVFASLSVTLFYAGLAVCVPWLHRSRGIGFAGRVLLPLISLTGLQLQGADFRSFGTMLAMMPIHWFLIGALLDFLLKIRPSWKDLPGRLLVTAGYLMLANRFWSKAQPEYPWLLILDLLGLGVGLWFVWKAPPRDREEPVGLLRANVLTERGRHLATRIAAVVIIAYPAIIFLNQIDAGDRLRWSATDTTLLGEGDARWFWMPRGNFLHKEDFGRLELFLFPEQDPALRKKVEAALTEQRAKPGDAAATEALRALFPLKLSPDLAKGFLGLVPLVYLDPGATSDGRIASGILAETGSGQVPELRKITASTADDIEARTSMAQVVVLCYILLSLLVLWNRGRTSALALWLAIFLCGAVAGWAESSLPYFFQPLEFVIWQHYGQSALAPVFYGWLSLLQGFSTLCLNLNKYGISLAVVLTLICWPPRPGRAVKTFWDRFWVQLPKVALTALILWSTPFAAALVDGWFGGKDYAIMAAVVLLPFALMGFGWWLHRSRAAFSPVPVLTAPLLVAFLLQREAGSLWALERVFFGTEGSWAGWLGVLAVVVAFFLVVREMDRGHFLEIPNSNGLAWIIILGALPFIFAKIGNPVADLLASTGLFTQAGAELLGIGVSVMLLDPVKDWLKFILNRLTIPGLKKLESDAQATLETIIKQPLNPSEAIGSFAHFLTGNGLARFSLWQNTGDGRFGLIDYEGMAPGVTTHRISPLLEEKLAEYSNPLSITASMRDLDFVLVREEFRELAEALDATILLPVTVSGVLLGVLGLPEHFGKTTLLRDAAADVIEELAREVLPLATQNRTLCLRDRRSDPARA